MTLSIWKFELPVTDSFALEMPKGAVILTIQCQNNTPMFWSKVNPKAPKELRYFRIIGTGHPFSSDENLKYVGTCQMNEGALIWHVFESPVASSTKASNN